MKDNMSLNNLDSSYGALVIDAVEDLATQGAVEERGAVFTRNEVVNFILNLVGYTADRPLTRLKLLESSFGGGDFLLPVIERLLASWRHYKKRDSVEALFGAIRAVELHRETFNRTRLAAIAFLEKNGLKSSLAIELADSWLVQGDFLLLPLKEKFSFVVGNPPYVRQELIPEPLLQEYRSRFTTMYDRADLYVPFIEQSLNSLAEGGVLGFICSDRWMKNKYGGPLRKMISDRFHLINYVDMVDTPAFHSEVTAYPAITVIGRQKTGPTRIAHRPAIEKEALSILASELHIGQPLKHGSLVLELNQIVNASEPWLLDSPDQIEILRRIESQYPSMEEVGCKVGIGVATGADKVFLGNFDELDVEQDCKLPLVTTKDISSGEIAWKGLGVINPFGKEGQLVDLKRYPKLRAYFEKQKDLIKMRHCAQKSPDQWYRTIDRIYPELLKVPKLLIPDIKGEANIVFDKGDFYPHHNLYYVVSSSWSLRALQAVLLSRVTRLFVTAYSIKMAGGYLRFQAQYLRRIRIPGWQDVPAGLRAELINAGTKRDLELCDKAVFKLYGLTVKEKSALGGNGD